MSERLLVTLSFSDIIQTTPAPWPSAYHFRVDARPAPATEPSPTEGAPPEGCL